MPLDKEKYYTMQVHLNSHYDRENKLIGTPIEFKDLTYEQFQQTRKVVWQQGILIEHTPISYELIDPLHIRAIFFLMQPAKFGI